MTVWVPFYSADGSGLLILPLVNGFHDGLRTVLLCGWQRMTHISARQQLSQRFTCRIAQRMAVDCQYFRLSTAFTTVCTPYCSADGSGLLILPLVNGFPGLHAILLCRWERIAHTSACQRLSRGFAFSLTQRMVAHCPYFLSSRAFMTVCSPYRSADGIRLLVHPLVKGFPVSLHAVLLSGWQRIVYSSAHQQLLWFRYCFALGMTEDCSFFHLLMAFTMVCLSFYSADGSP